MTNYTYFRKMHLVFCILNWEIRKHAHIINMSYTHIPSQTYTNILQLLKMLISLNSTRKLLNKNMITWQYCVSVFSIQDPKPKTTLGSQSLLMHYSSDRGINRLTYYDQLQNVNKESYLPTQEFY